MLVMQRTLTISIDNGAVVKTYSATFDVNRAILTQEKGRSVDDATFERFCREAKVAFGVPAQSEDIKLKGES